MTIKKFKFTEDQSIGVQKISDRRNKSQLEPFLMKSSPLANSISRDTALSKYGVIK